MSAEAEMQGKSRVWRGIQAALWLAGLGLLACLVRRPELGLHLLWDVLIPVAPLLLVLAPGVWRNICPLATTALLPRHLGLSWRRPLSPRAQEYLHGLAVLLLLVIIPLRHSHLNIDGPTTAGVLALTGALAVLMGLIFEWKSGWCASLCPVHPVERLYGSRPAVVIPNAHCDACRRCTKVCPDSTPAMDPRTGRAGLVGKLSSALLVGGFPGFIWGWFQTPDYRLPLDPPTLQTLYGPPLAGLGVTLAIYLVLRLLPFFSPTRLGHLFAAASLVCYYGFRLPMLLGFGAFPGDGMLVDLRQTLPAWFPTALRIGSTLFLLLWMLRPGPRRSWTRRPAFGDAAPAPAAAAPETSRFPIRLQELPKP